MTFTDWREPLRLLEEQSRPATSDQWSLADKVGLRLGEDVPRAVASVLLEDFLRPMVWGEAPDPATDKQRAFLVQLGAIDVAADADLSKAAGSAWIDHCLSLQNQQSLRDLRLARGDQVLKRWTSRDPASGIATEFLDHCVVSSIGTNGLVYFKGGNGKCGWPSSLQPTEA